MAELRISLDIRVTPRVARWGLSAFLLAFCAPELASESVTLTTYYPAPSGVYSQMITTGNTYLARDSGSLMVRTTTSLATLTVNGDANISTDLTLANAGSELLGPYHLNMGYSNWSDTLHGAGGMGIVNDNGSYQKLMIVGNSSAGGSRVIGMWDDVTINDDLDVSGHLDVSDVGVFRRYAGGNCSGISPTVYVSGVTNCAGGTYATLASGVMSKYTVINDPSNATGNMLCCTCPTGGCPSF